MSADPVDAVNASDVISTTKFASSDTGVATVTDDGTITAVAVGSATITATSGSFTAAVSVTVSAA